MADSKKDDSYKEYLISLVRARPVLYSKSEKAYKDSRTVKKNNWEDITKELASEFPSECGQWTGMLRYFSRVGSEGQCWSGLLLLRGDAG